MISDAEPSYVGLLTLMTEPSAPLHAEIREGRFRLLSPLGVVEETILLLEHTELRKPCVFRSNHASNYLSLKGNLPEDRARMLTELKSVRNRDDLVKDERFRML
jgi:hypothetical protein